MNFRASNKLLGLIRASQPQRPWWKRLFMFRTIEHDRHTLSGTLLGVFARTRLQLTVTEPFIERGVGFVNTFREELVMTIPLTPAAEMQLYRELWVRCQLANPQTLSEIGIDVIGTKAVIKPW